MGDGTLRLKTAFVILIAITLIGTASAAGEGGVNVEPVVEDTIFIEIDHTETTTDLEDWEITLTLSDDAISNNTTFELTTQMCNNDGVCLPPTVAETFSNDGKTFTSAVTTVEDHSYVNWRIKATYSDDNNTTETFPSKGFYKTWSDCWFNDGEWGGDGCKEGQTDGDDSFLPAVSAALTASAFLFAAATRSE